MRLYKTILIGIMVTLFGACGGGSSKEARELLEKILQFVGIPQEIVVNVCQDKNRDGICGSGELFTKVSIDKEDTFDDILQKISLTDDGKYFLETYNPEIPILVELQDEAKVIYDEGKFTLNFNGFRTKNDDNETKEISIMESMIDNNALSKNIADKFRTLHNATAQDKYYVMLLDVLETNINTLRSNGLDKTTTISANIKEMGDELTSNQDKADAINACGDDQACVDNELQKLSAEIIITEEEALEIKSKENNSAVTPTPIADDGNKEVVYGKWFKPSKNVCNNNGGDYNNWAIDSTVKDCMADRESGKTICNISGGKLPSIDILKQVITDCGGTLNDIKGNQENSSYQVCYKKNGFISNYSFWSSSDTTDGYALYIDFYNGTDGFFDKSAKNIIQCLK